MIETAITSTDDRVLLLAPTKKDAATTVGLLRENGLAVECCEDFTDLLHELDRGAAALILPEEAITPERNARLAAVLQHQPPWSDLPMLVLAYAGADSKTSTEVMRTLGNVTLLERPLRVATLLSAV